MTEEFNVNEYIIDKHIKKLGMTREQFENSEVKNLLEAMMHAYVKTVHETALKLMKEKSLSYGEATFIAHKMVHKSVEWGLKNERTD